MKQKVILGKSEIGNGLFARKSLKAFEPIFFITGKVITFDDLSALPDDGASTIQIDNDEYVNPGFPAILINHSCVPNSGIRDNLCVVAIQEIAAGEEITFDYSTSVWERHFEMECQCGEPCCRGKIGDFDLLPIAVQERYLQMGIVQSFIVEKLKRSDLEFAGFAGERGVAA